jgi:hypothetical protein
VNSATHSRRLPDWFMAVKSILVPIWYGGVIWILGGSEKFLPNVKAHAPLPARAGVDHGVEVKTTGNHGNRAAGRGCMTRLVSRFFILGLCDMTRITASGYQMHDGSAMWNVGNRKKPTGISKNLRKSQSPLVVLMRNHPGAGSHQS